MPIAIFQGRYYEFHKERNIARPGAETFMRAGIEIGPEISREDAARQVQSGRDVYTLRKTDAYKLAVQVAGAHTFEKKAGNTVAEVHTPKEPTLSGRTDVYYPHYHPGGAHPSDPGGPGHVFFGERGES